MSIYFLLMEEWLTFRDYSEKKNEYHYRAKEPFFRCFYSAINDCKDS